MTDATNTELMAMTNAELVGVHNALAEQVGANDLKAWKGKKELIVDRIEALRAQVIQHPEPMFDEDEGDDFEAVMNGEKPVTQEEATAAAEAAAETIAAEAEPTAEPEPTAEASEAKSDRTIKAASVELLCHIDFYENRDEKIDPAKNVVEASDPKARSVGLAYDEIIRRIQEEFPGCSTTVACLRWYSVKIRVEEHGYEDLRLPQRRPRAKPRTAK